MIDLQQLSIRYPGFSRPALDSVTLRIADGEFVAIMGENGSGKSTLVRALNGLLVPASGAVVIDGMTTRDPSQIPRIRERIGIVFQNPHLQITSLTVEREIGFGLQNIGVEPEEMARRIESRLTGSGLAPLRGRAPRTLSGGEQQRLALASVLAMQPRHLVLDEATSLLSPPSRERVLWMVMKERAERGTAILLVTQFRKEARLADRLIRLHEGMIAYDGPAAND